MSNNTVNILIVDDEQEICSILAARFKALNFNPVIAHSGNEAWEILSHTKIDIVISDVKMNDGDGIALVKRVREHNPREPKLFLVSGFNLHSKEEIFALGVDGTFEKPFESRALMNAVRKARMSSLARWQLTSSHEPEMILEIQSTSLAELEKSAKVKFGLGGFAMFTPLTPNEGDRIAFDFKFTQDTQIASLKGIGLVQWCNKNQKCVGVEIEHVEQPGIQYFVKWLEEKSLIAFIPAAVDGRR